MLEHHKLRRSEVLKGATAGVAGLTVLGLSACGSKADGGGQQAKGADAAPKPSKPTGTLRIGLTAGTTGLRYDPDYATPGSAGISVIYNLFDPLVTVINGKPQMLLATEVTSDNAIDWDIKLRKDAVFSDGRPVRPEDVIFSFERRAKPDSGNFATYQILKSVKKTGPDSVRVTLKQARSNFVKAFGLISEIVPEGFDPNKPIGSGPYKLESYVEGSKTVLVANDRWWGEGPYIERIEIYQFKDDTAKANALLAGQVDAIESVPTSQLATFRSSAKLTQVVAPTDNYTPFAMNATVKPFDDVRVRQAFRLIVDRPRMIEQVLAGQGQLGNDIYGAVDSGGVAARFPQREQDLEQAKALLKAAGHADLTVQLSTSPVTLGAVDMSQVFVEQAKGAGVTVKLKQLDPVAYFTPEGGYEAYPFSISIGASTPGYLAVTELLTTKGFNETHIEQAIPSYTKLLQEALRTVDDAKRTELIGEMQKIDYDQGGYIIWGFTPQVSVFDKKLHGVEKINGTYGLNNFSLDQLWLA
jgi:peptide/nickel transport system substrate-binding protein